MRYDQALDSFARLLAAKLRGEPVDDALIDKARAAFLLAGRQKDWQEMEERGRAIAGEARALKAAG